MSEVKVKPKHQLIPYKYNIDCRTRSGQEIRTIYNIGFNIIYNTFGEASHSDIRRDYPIALKKDIIAIDNLPGVSWDEYGPPGYLFMRADDFKVIIPFSLEDYDKELIHRIRKQIKNLEI